MLTFGNSAFECLFHTKFSFYLMTLSGDGGSKLKSQEIIPNLLRARMKQFLTCHARICKHHEVSSIVDKICLKRFMQKSTLSISITLQTALRRDWFLNTVSLLNNQQRRNLNGNALMMNAQMGKLLTNNIAVLGGCREGEKRCLDVITLAM